MRQAYFTHRFPAAYWARTMRASRRECAISLIEVLVAIALLTIGVLSVITLFPAGFLTLEIAANATNADRIGQRELEKLNATNAGQMGIIESIYSNYEAGAPAIGTPANVVPVLAPAGTSPTTPVLLGQNNDINAYRLIKGETVRVPPALSVDVNATATLLSLYTPAFAPIVSPSNASVPGQPASVFAVHGLPWSRRSVNSNGSATASQYPDPSSLLGTTYQPQYLIDYTNGKIALPGASFTQTVLFQFTDGTTPTPITYHVAITVSAANSNQWIDPFNTAGVSVAALSSSPTVPTLPAEPTLPWKTGSDVLSRDFQCVNQATPTSALTTFNAGSFTADPYQYQIYGFTGTASTTTADTVTGAASSGDILGMTQTTPVSTAPTANFGTIAFNPVGANIKDTNGRPLVGAIDYEVYDWHIISEDRTASSSTGSSSPAIRLSLRSLYSQSANDLFSDNTKYAGLFYNFAATGVLRNPDVTVLDLQTGTILTKTTDYNVDYPDGVVNIVNPQETNVPLRIFYRAREDWGVALSKAPSSYVLTDYTNTSATPAYGECQIDAVNRKLYFPLADLNKSVQVNRLIDTGNVIYPNLGLQQLVRDSGQSRCVLDLSGTIPTPLAAAATQTGTVQGATVQAQVIWKEQGIWKHREITSMIPAGAMQMAVQQ